MMKFSKQTSNDREMNANRRELIMQRWNVIQPELRNDVGPLTPKLEKVIHILECIPLHTSFCSHINQWVTDVAHDQGAQEKDVCKEML